MRANEATEGTGSTFNECIFSCTLIGPWSNPDCSKAARTAIACAFTSAGKRLQRCRRALILRPLSYRVERLAGDPMLNAEG